MAGDPQAPAAVQKLMAGGVRLPLPASVQVAEDVDPSRIAAGAVIHPGCRLAGRDTSVGPGCELGTDGPVTLRNCQLGENVRLGSGTFDSATLLDDVEVGPNAHVRPGTLLEEGARAGHAVGLKQTVLLPFVTAGSLINFCDVLMAGGTGRDDHSEIGSSYVHFNFTPRGDKATASLVGDVARGVMLDQPPVFLGGQGGLVGPVRLGFGTVIPAGTVWRKDAPGGGFLQVDPAGKPHRADGLISRRYGRISRVVRNNLTYMGNLVALRAWYVKVRASYMQRTPWATATHEGALARIAEGLEERLKRLGGLVDRLPASLSILAGEPGDGNDMLVAEQKRLVAGWPALSARLREVIDREEDESLTDSYGMLRSQLDGGDGSTYLAAVRGLDRSAREAGTAWLQNLVDVVVGLWSDTE